MSIPPFVVDVAAGTLSGALVAYLPLRRRDSTPPGTNVRVAGVDNTTVVDQSRNHYWEITQNTTHVAAAQSRTSQSNADETLVMVAIAGVIAVVVFLFVWPVALGFLFGSCVVTSVVYIYATSRGALRTAGLRGAAIAHSTICLAVTTVTCGFAFFSSADGHGLVALERDLSTRFPGYSSSVPRRWEVLTRHTSDVFNLIGWHGALTLFAQVGGLVMCSLITTLLAIRALGAVSLSQQAAGRRIGRLKQDLGARLLTERRHVDIGITLLIGAIALFLASGLGTRLLMARAHAVSHAADLSDAAALVSRKVASRWLTTPAERCDGDACAHRSVPAAPVLGKESGHCCRVAVGRPATTDPLSRPDARAGRPCAGHRAGSTAAPLLTRGPN